MVLFTNPLRWSEKRIRTYIEKQTPIGSSYESVLAYIEKREWYDSRFQGSDGETKGVYLRGEIGRYRVLFETYVTVFWEFDSDLYLEQIRVWKTINAF